MVPTLNSSVWQSDGLFACSHPVDQGLFDTPQTNNQWPKTSQCLRYSSAIMFFSVLKNRYYVVQSGLKFMGSCESLFSASSVGGLQALWCQPPPWPQSSAFSVHVYVCMWKPEVSHQCCMTGTIHFFFLNGDIDSDCLGTCQFSCVGCPGPSRDSPVPAASPALGLQCCVCLLICFNVRIRSCLRGQHLNQLRQRSSHRHLNFENELEALGLILSTEKKIPDGSGLVLRSFMGGK